MRRFVCAVLLWCSSLPAMASDADTTRHKAFQQLLSNVGELVDGTGMACPSARKHKASFGFRENIYLLSQEERKSHVVLSRGLEVHIVQQLLPVGHVSACRVRVIWVDAETSQVLFGSYDGCSSDTEVVQGVPHPLAASYSRWTTRREDMKEVNPQHRTYWELVLDGVMHDTRDYVAQCRR